MNLAEKPSLPRMEIQLVIWCAEIGLPHLMVVLERAQPPTPPEESIKHQLAVRAE